MKAREADSVVAATLLDQARQLVAAGVSPAIDATRSEVSFGAVRTELELARNAVDRTRLDLLRALDLAPGAPLELADSLGLGAVDLPLDPDEAGRYARERRAELAAERNRTEAIRRTLHGDQGREPAEPWAERVLPAVREPRWTTSPVPTSSRSA